VFLIEMLWMMVCASDDKIKYLLSSKERDKHELLLIYRCWCSWGVDSRINSRFKTKNVELEEQRPVVGD
jgi:hypothetical protein